jgi:single-strand DNA-binding protein
MHVGHFAGYLGRDAETRFLPSGDPVANFSIGVNTGAKDQPKTLWVDCALWGKRAEALAQYLVKGTPVTVCGDVDIRTYTKTDGTSGAALTCRVDKLTFGGKSGDSGGYREPSQSAAPAAPPRPRPQPAPQPAAAGFDDDVPF